MGAADRTLSVRDMAHKLRISKNKVLAMIHSGKLPALNVSNTPRRPQYRILPSALSALEVQPETPPASRRAKASSKDYFPEL